MLKLATALLAYVGLIASIVLTRHSDELTQRAYVLGISMVMLSLTGTLYSFLQGFEEMHYQAWGMVIDKVISTALIVLALLCTAAVGVSVSTILLAGRAIEILYPHREFSGTVPALRVLALALLSMYINAIFVTVLLTTDGEKKWARAGAFAAVLNPVANLLMIPWLGHIGAAITTVLTEVTLLLLAWQGCPAGIFNRSDLSTVLRSLLAGGALAAGLTLGLHWGLVPALALGVPAYLAAIVLLGVLTPADLSAIRDAFVARLGGGKALEADEAAV